MNRNLTITNNIPSQDKNIIIYGGERLKKKMKRKKKKIQNNQTGMNMNREFHITYRLVSLKEKW